MVEGEWLVFHEVVFYLSLDFFESYVCAVVSSKEPWRGIGRAGNTYNYSLLLQCPFWHLLLDRTISSKIPCLNGYSALAINTNVML